MKFKSILKTIILENSRFEILRDALTKPTQDKEGKPQKPKMSLEEFLEIIQADPTTRMNNVDPMTAKTEDLAKIKAGKYVNWLIKNFLSPQTERGPQDPGYKEEVRQVKQLFLEDLYKVTLDLQKYEKFKNRLSEEDRQIQNLTPRSLYELVKDFSLEKTKATKQDKEEASTTYQHPGGEIIFRGDNWTIAKISDTGALGKDAACFYGGYHLEPIKGETKWCTSSPGLNWFDRYIKDGPLYVVIPNDNTGRKGEKSGLPADRYQFHFPSNQFMDVHDHQVNLIDMLNGPMKELKNVFKPEFAKGLTAQGGENFVIDNFEHGAIGKFIALYGLDDLIKSLPDTLKQFQIQNKGNKEVNVKIPKEFVKFKQLEFILMQNCISELPDFICELPNLAFLSVPQNQNLKKIPECIANLPKLVFLNIQNTGAKLPESLRLKGALEMGSGMWDLALDD